MSGFGQHDYMRRQTADYAKLAETLKGGRSTRKGHDGRYYTMRRVENNTYVYRRDESTLAVRLHSTDVVLLHEDGRYTLDSGGWLTSTTKDRINGYSPANVSQHLGLWYMRDGSVFYDRMTVDAEGRPVKPLAAKGAEGTKRRLDTLVRDYVKGFGDLILSEGMPEDFAGDCFLCKLPLPEDGAREDVSHLLSHLQEPYYVGTLLVNAIKETAGDVGVVWRMIGADAGRGRLNWNLRRCLRRYFLKRKPALFKLLDSQGEAPREDEAAA